MSLEIPKLLDLPAKLLAIVDNFDKFPYFLAEGGRGGGKSQAVARLLLYLAEHYKLRITCGREIQNNIEESVYTLLVDAIRENSLNFSIYATKLVHNETNTIFTFKGFREQGRVSIKGLEGVDILWIDEAQAITKNTLDVIIPTIRKGKSKVFFTMNRHLRNDAVYKEFSTREDCLHIKINYTDNPFCSEKLLKEALICKDKSVEDYRHIWLGEPLEEADNLLFNESELLEAKNVDFLGCGYHDTVLGVDIARYGGDKCVATILQKRGPIKWEVKHVERWSKKDLMETTGRVIDVMSRFKPSSTSIDADGMGAGVIDRLGELKVYVNEFRGGMSDQISNKQSYANHKTECYYELKDLIARGNLALYDTLTIDQLLTVMFTHKSNGQRIIVSKEVMKTKGFKSPDDADSLMMAVHATKFISRKIEQNEDFKTPIVNQRSTGNLFKIAGYR